MYADAGWRQRLLRWWRSAVINTGAAAVASASQTQRSLLVGRSSVGDPADPAPVAARCPPAPSVVVQVAAAAAAAVGRGRVRENARRGGTVVWRSGHIAEVDDRQQTQAGLATLTDGTAVVREYLYACTGCYHSCHEPSLLHACPYIMHLIRPAYCYRRRPPIVTKYTHRRDPSAVVDSRISRRTFVRRKFAEKIPASRNRRQNV